MRIRLAAALTLAGILTLATVLLRDVRRGGACGGLVRGLVVRTAQGAHRNSGHRGRDQVRRDSHDFLGCRFSRSEPVSFARVRRQLRAASAAVTEDFTSRKSPSPAFGGGSAVRRRAGPLLPMASLIWKPDPGEHVKRERRTAESPPWRT